MHIHRQRSAHGYVRLLVHHHGGEGHIGQDRVRRYAITGWAGERRWIKRVMPRVTAAEDLAVGHIWETKSRVSWRMHDQDATAVHIKQLGSRFWFAAGSCCLSFLVVVFFPRTQKVTRLLMRLEWSSRKNSSFHFQRSTYKLDLAPDPKTVVDLFFIPALSYIAARQTTPAPPTVIIHAQTILHTYGMR